MFRFTSLTQPRVQTVRTVFIQGKLLGLHEFFSEKAGRKPQSPVVGV